MILAAEEVLLDGATRKVKMDLIAETIYQSAAQSLRKRNRLQEALPTAACERGWQFPKRVISLLLRRGRATSDHMLKTREPYDESVFARAENKDRQRAENRLRAMAESNLGWTIAPAEAKQPLLTA